ncbi:ArgE/DapE family deacylase [Effusibacillus consociatus]|uniref:Probable succinyl-diaminopimelate desuccinylase n=1 Tax=Effusibacillus consociatus TaxID=1117041 RepID=A0ABV9Q0I2_9BACL
MESAKQDIIQWIESQKEPLIHFLRELLTIPSDNPPGDCFKIADHIQKRLHDFQFENVSFLEVEPEEVKQAGMQKVFNVVSTTVFGEGKGPEIALNSHGDVVAPGLGWTQDPYGGTIVDGNIYGRGAAVSKSDIAVYTFAVMAVRKAAERLSGKVSLAFTFDEETGGNIGPKWLLERGYIQPDMAICAGFTYSIVNAHNGCLHLEIQARGKSAHAAAPETGYDAIEAMTGILQTLYSYRRSLSKIRSSVPGIESPTLVVGLISGGINTNVVPDQCTIRIDRRLIPEENGDQVESEIRQLVEQTVNHYKGVKVNAQRILLANSFGPVSEDTPLIQTLSDNWKKMMEGQLAIHGVPIYADARHFAEVGVPVVMFGAGPRTLLEANGHRADEHVRAEDVIKATKIVALTLYDLLKGEPE